MNFIEKLFGVSPDGGSGLFELILFLIPVAGIMAIRAWRKRSAANRKLPCDPNLD